MAQTNIGTGMMPPQQYEPFLSFLQQLVLPGSGWTTVHAADQFSCYITPPGLLDPARSRTIAQNVPRACGALAYFVASYDFTDPRQMDNLVQLVGHLVHDKESHVTVTRIVEAVWFCYAFHKRQQQVDIQNSGRHAIYARQLFAFVNRMHLSGILGSLSVEFPLEEAFMAWWCKLVTGGETGVDTTNGWQRFVNKQMKSLLKTLSCGKTHQQPSQDQSNGGTDDVSFYNSEVNDDGRGGTRD